MRKLPLLLFTTVIIGSIYLRFFNLGWGEGYFFHPDERNIAYAVSQLSFPQQMNPHFFAYGSLPLYTIYFLGVFANIVTQKVSPTTISFEQAILISRLLSAILSSWILLLILLFGRQFFSKKVIIVTTFFSAMSVGYIQYAHFGTFEMWIASFSLLFFFTTLMLLKKKQIITVITSGVLFGALFSIKVSTVVLFPLILLAIMLPWKQAQTANYWTRVLMFLLLFLVVMFGTVFITSPYYFLDFSSLQTSLSYESAVALGTLPVFYTGGFVESTPVIFQLSKVFPFLLNPVLTLVLVVGWFWIGFLAVKTKSTTLLFVLLAFSLLFFSQAFLYVKWTRYMVSTLPFVYLLLSLFLSELQKEAFYFWKIQKNIIVFLLIVSGVYVSIYSLVVLAAKDTRVAARDFAKATILQNARILGEDYDLGMLPFNEDFSAIELFNFYDLDVVGGKTQQDLKNALQNKKYIILPSQRVIKSRTEHPSVFPVGHQFYSQLLSGQTGFVKIYETPCDFFCKILYMGDPVYTVEETVSVFDRPAVLIFKRL